MHTRRTGPRWRAGPSSIAVALALAGLCGSAPGAEPNHSDDGATAAAAAPAPDPALHGDARTLWTWVARSNDHQGASFIFIDKKAAMVHVFDGQRRLLGSSPVLLGLTVGDDSVPGIGSKAIADVQPTERTTPAGRFIAERGRNAKGVDVIWIDYDLGLSMHRVIDDVRADRRPERLASSTSDDNRISYGCVNVPIAFYESTIKPLFKTYRAVVYILPEQRTLAQVFGMTGTTTASTR